VAIRFFYGSGACLVYLFYYPAHPPLYVSSPAAKTEAVSGRINKKKLLITPQLG